MIIIYCSDPFDPKQPDMLYAAEATAARTAGFEIGIFSFETLTYERNVKRALRLIKPRDTETPAIYRGWMLKSAQYAALYAGLAAKGIQLINSAEAYQHCHHLPASYDMIAGQTAKTIWLPLTGAPDFDAIMPLLETFGRNPIIVKDYVKSQKHYWHEACFIPDASDRAAVEKVVGRFVELQSSDLNVGLVFREFIDLEPLTTHSKSGMPLTKEFRVFVLDGRPLAIANYWEEGDYADTQAQLEPFTETMRAVNSRFFTMDIAKRRDGGWIIMELGDGQVAGLPDTIDATHFYTQLAQQLL